MSSRRTTAQANNASESIDLDEFFKHNARIRPNPQPVPWIVRTRKPPVIVVDEDISEVSDDPDYVSESELPAWHEPPAPEPIQRIEGFNELPDLREVLELRARTYDQHMELDRTKTELMHLRYAYMKLADDFQSAVNALEGLDQRNRAPYESAKGRLMRRREKLRKR